MSVPDALDRVVAEVGETDDAFSRVAAARALALRGPVPDARRADAALADLIGIAGSYPPKTATTNEDTPR